MLKLNAKEVAQFWRAARQHYNVARRLAEFGGDKVVRSEEAYHATYIGGYAVECGLKALYLSQVPQKDHAKIIDGRFKEIGHNLEGISHSLGQLFGIEMPATVRHLFRTRITPKHAPGAIPVWDVGMRYRAGTMVRKSALEFLDAVKALLSWISGA